jgi:hypothetical protein
MNRGDEPIHLIIYMCVCIYMYISTWKCRRETPCIAILNKQKCHFFFFYKIIEQENGTGPTWGAWYQ